MPEEREDVETKSSDSPEVHQQTKFMAWFEKAFPWLLVGGAALGLVLMICLPVIFFQEKTAEQLLAQSNLRLALLYTTGGVIAALGLLETYRKNTNDRTKANADINAALKNQDHQTKVLKEQIRQFDENAFKERKAERRERYTKAVEQLGDEKAPVRMGGVYTLVGLVDEWLEEKSLSDDERFKEGQVIINNLCAYIRSPFTLTSYYDELSENEKLKEGQVIINNLCAYIRSPFTLASHYDELSQANPASEGIYKDKEQEFYADKAILDSEADVRLSIIKEIHDRIQGPDKNTPGAWSDFEYDFSGSTFFYPIDLTNSYYAKPINFSGATYEGGANFSRSTYEGWADFTGSTYQGWANFSRSIYKSGAYFSSSTYGGDADFSRSIFYSETYFGKGKYSNSSSCFTNRAPQFYDKTNRKNTLFGSPNNDFTVDTDKGYSIVLNSGDIGDIPLKCKFLNPKQRDYLARKIRKMEKINNKLLETKGSKENAELLEDLRNFNKELHEWREEATTVKVEDAAAEDTEN